MASWASSLLLIGHARASYYVFISCDQEQKVEGESTEERAVLSLRPYSASVRRKSNLGVSCRVPASARCSIKLQGSSLHILTPSLV